MSKISELSDGGSLVSSDYLIAVRSGGNVKVRMDQINVDQIDLGDNEFIRLGNSQDLTIVHNASNSIINQAGIGNLLIQKAGTTKASITANGLEFPDNSKAIFGAGSDLQIYHDGSNSYIKDNGTGRLTIQSASDFLVANTANTQNYIYAVESGAVNLYHSGVKKFETTATGIDITGTATAASFEADAGGTFTTATGNDLNIVYPAGRSLFIKEGSETHVTVDNAGNVGIGTTSPSAPLNISATYASDTTEQFRIQDNTGGKLDFFGYANGSKGIQAYADDGSTFYNLNLNPLGGNVGIGLTTGISSKLHVNTEMSIGADADNRAIVGYTPSRFYIGTRQSGTNYFDTVSVSGGNVGIGTTSPASYYSVPLVVATSGSQGGITIANTTANQQGMLAFADGTSGSDRYSGYIDYNHNVNVMSFGTNGGLERLRIDASGNVGISNSIPSSFNGGANNLVVGSGSGAEGMTIYGGAESNIFFADGTAGTAAYIGRIEYAHSSDTMRFYVNNSNAMTIGSDGQLTSSVAGGVFETRSDGGGFHYKQLLDVATAGALFTGRSNRGDLASIALYQTATGANGGYIKFNTSNSGSTSPTEKARILSDGSFLIGMTSQSLSTSFKIQGPNEASKGFNAFFVSMGNSGGGYPYIGYNCAPTTTGSTYNRYANDYASWIDFHAGGIRTFTSAGGTGNTSGSPGPYMSQGGTSWTSASDQRLKDDVQEISYGLDTVKALEPVSYVRNDRDVEGRELGFIAQGVEGVVDEIVNVDDTGYYGLNYQGLIPILTKAIQEQQATIEALEARITALES